MDEGDEVSLQRGGLLFNDTDPDSEISIVEVGGAVNGSVRLEDTMVIYSHDGSETTTGYFTYTISDGVNTATARVTVDVMGVNDPPLAGLDFVEVDEGGAVTVETASLLGNDVDAEGDALVVEGVGNPVNGTREAWTAPQSPTRHDGSETSTGSFTYTVSDHADTTTVQVTVDVIPVNDSPLGALDTVEVHEGDGVTLETASLLRNDVDAEDDELAVIRGERLR